MPRSSPPCRRVKILLGVFVLGGLRGQEESLVRTHLAGCARCQAECGELAEVPLLLDMITAEEAAGAGDLPDQACTVAGTAGEQAERPGSQGDGAKPSCRARAGLTWAERRLSARSAEPPS
jgi:hypothetical protein